MKTLAVLGSGMQGIASAYDAAKFGKFERIILVDTDIARAIDGASRVNTLTKLDLCEPARLDASSRSGLAKFLESVDLAIAALPYHLHPLVEEVALDGGHCSVVDMGIDTRIARHIQDRAPEAREKGITVITDCGLAPGLVNVLAADLVAQGAVDGVKAYCGGIPVRPVGPLGYVMRFNMDSVIDEYSEDVLALRRGHVVMAPPLDLLEEIEFDGVGTLEAFTTSGGSGTAPYFFRSMTPNYEYKTLRYPGHAEAMKLFRDCGFWSDDYSSRLGQTPRQAFSTIMEISLSMPEIEDIVVVRVEALGEKGVTRLELLEHPDPETGFTAMERLTGFSTSIVALELAAGRIASGVMGCEQAIQPCRFREELERRGINVRETVFLRDAS